MKPTIEQRRYASPLFENMPQMNDETVWDLLELLLGLVDAYESHYTVELERLRAQRYREMLSEEDRMQLHLPLPELDEDPF